MNDTKGWAAGCRDKSNPFMTSVDEPTVFVVFAVRSPGAGRQESSLGSAAPLLPDGLRRQRLPLGFTAVKATGRIGARAKFLG